MQHVDVLDVVRVSLWFAAGLISFYFSLSSGRIWTSISTGFLLVFLSEGYLVAPWIAHPTLMALHAVAGTIAILVMTHGFMEYYVFSRTLEVPGAKRNVYAMTALVLAASCGFLWLNPVLGAGTVRNIRLIENACWVFLGLINLDMIRKIYLQVRGSPIASGFIAFGVVFILIFLWRGSMLYLQVFGWDEEARALGMDGGAASFPMRVRIAEEAHRAASLLSSASVGATFVYLLRLMR